MTGSGFGSCKMFRRSDLVTVFGIANVLQFGLRLFQWMKAISHEQDNVEIYVDGLEGNKGQFYLAINYDFTGLIFDFLWYLLMILCSSSIVFATILKHSCLLFPYIIPVSYNIVSAVNMLVKWDSTIPNVLTPIFGPEIPCAVYHIILLLDIVLMIWSIWIVVDYYNELLKEEMWEDYDQENLSGWNDGVDGIGESTCLKNSQSMPHLTFANTKV